MRAILKSFLNALFLAFAFPLAAASGFGRFEGMYLLGAQTCSRAPGLPGDYLRIAYYRLTLRQCPLESRIQFGSYFAHSMAVMGRGVYIGSYCILGRTEIGDRTQIASGVQILSGRRQHARGGNGSIEGSDRAMFETVPIGADCWIGAGAIVMAAVGPGTTIGAGSVVVQPIPGGCVAAGNPARIIRSQPEEHA